MSTDKRPTDSPAPGVIEAGQARAGGRIWVLVRISTPQGRISALFDPPSLRAVGEGIVRLADADQLELPKDTDGLLRP
jgi:hypothetical protein